MVFTHTEIIALVVIALSFIKVLFLIVAPNLWMSFARKIYSHARLTSFVMFVLALVVLNYLLVEITIVQIVAITAFVALLIGMALSHDAEHLVTIQQGLIKKKQLWHRYWFYVIIWVLLMAWALTEIFRT